MTNLPFQESSGVEKICSRGELSGTRPTECQSHSGGGQVEAPDQPSVLTSDRDRWKAAQRIEASVRYMLQHLHQPMKVSTLSARLGLSQSTFFVHFKSVTGRTPLDFLIRARMHRAGELLAEPKRQIKQVAAMLGYDDPFYFSRLFKSVHGIAPREYRTRKAESDHQVLEPKPSGDTLPAVSVTPALPHPSQAGENRMTERIQVGRFQSAAQRAPALPEGRRDSSSQRVQPCSISVHP